MLLKGCDELENNSKVRDRILANSTWKSLGQGITAHEDCRK